MWKYSPVLQNTAREYEEYENKFIEYCQEVFRNKLHWQYEIKNLDDIAHAHDSILEHDTFGYDSDPNTENGIILRMIKKGFDKIYENRIDLKARLDSEEALFKDNQEKEDKVLIRLTSIDNHIEQGNKEIRSIRHNVSQPPPEKNAAQEQADNDSPEKAQQDINKTGLYPNRCTQLSGVA